MKQEIRSNLPEARISSRMMANIWFTASIRLPYSAIVSYTFGFLLVCTQTSEWALGNAISEHNYIERKTCTDIHPNIEELKLRSVTYEFGGRSRTSFAADFSVQSFVACMISGWNYGNLRKTVKNYFFKHIKSSENERPHHLRADRPHTVTQWYRWYAEHWIRLVSFDSYDSFPFRALLVGRTDFQWNSVPPVSQPYFCHFLRRFVCKGLIRKFRRKLRLSAFESMRIWRKIDFSRNAFSSIK